MESKLLTGGEKGFKIFSFALLSVISVMALLPFILIFMSSLTEENTLIRNGYSFFPKEFSLEAYKFLIMQSKVIWRSYLVSICITTIGTATNIMLTTMFAYPLSRQDFKYRNILAFILFFTMLFNGGIVPSYMMWMRIFQIKNTYMALLFPNLLMGAFNVILVRNYYKMNVPPAIIESAQLDGASELSIFFRIMFPLSIPVNVTVGLFAGIAYWNDWTNAMYYVDEPKYFGVQNMLMRLMNNIAFLASGQGREMVDTAFVVVPSVGVRMALAVIGVLPILVLYPILQKYLIKGIVVGAIKG